MKKFKKLITISCIAIMAVSTLNLSAFASLADREAAAAKAREEGYTVLDNMIDYSIYDDDMIYIKEQADAVEEYNKSLKNSNRAARLSSYSAWNMNNIYSMTTKSSSSLEIPYYFVPTANYMYFNTIIRNVNKQPYMTVNKLTNTSTGTLQYVGAYNVDEKPGTANTYEWNNYKRALDKGSKYVFAMWALTNWSSMEIDIYKSAM